MYITSGMIKLRDWILTCNFCFIQQLLAGCFWDYVAQSQCWQHCPSFRMPLTHHMGCEEEIPSFAFLRKLWQERGSSEPPSLEEQTRHQLLPEVSLGNAQLIGALDLVVPLHECCL